MKAVIDLARRARSYRECFVLMPSSWSGYAYTKKLNWVTAPFSASGRAAVPDEAGVYAFLVQPAVAPELNGSYVMYVGQSKSLRRRYGQYLDEAAGKKGSRIHIHEMFQNWITHIHFSYALVDEAELTAAEEALLEALWPPRNPSLPATIRAASRIL